MSNSTPPKHQTPNYKLVRHTRRGVNVAGFPADFVYHTWDKQPLRKDRKDLAS